MVSLTIGTRQAELVLPSEDNNCECGEMVYARDLKSLVERHAGSSPATRTKNKEDSHNGIGAAC